MKQVFIKNGIAVTEEVPAPTPLSGEVLVRVKNSCISVGTEMAGVQASADPIWKQAMKRPDKVLKALRMMARKGVNETMNIAHGHLNSGLVVGYSAMGKVIGYGDNVDDLQIGMRVACAGAQAAHHAEIIRVPRNLVTNVPDEVSDEDAASVTIGAIAMQGVRRATPTLGETFAVVGLGLIGQLTVQLLKANGCQVIGFDLDQARIDTAKDNGLDIGIMADEELLIQNIARVNNGVALDGVIVTAASKSDKVLEMAFQLTRRKGRVVLVGDVPMNINRADIYKNEIDFLISSSYGPGRYDRRYEEEGLDYPVSYVRWTENRNMGAYLSLIGQQKITPSHFIDSIYDIANVQDAYESLRQGAESKKRPLAILLSYPQHDSNTSTRIDSPFLLKGADRVINIGMVGLGGFAQGTHLPNLSTMKDKYHVRALMSRTSHNAHTVTVNERANYATTDIQQILDDDGINLVLISTRHDTHASYVLQSLKAGKHVFVEKPLAISNDELQQIEDFYQDDNPKAPILMTGFNRRFSPAIVNIIDDIANRNSPIMVNYRMNAGYIPLEHWVHGAQGGGRNIGEACHIYDLFNILTNSALESVDAQAIQPIENIYKKNDNFVATIKYKDGSICTLTYTALGNNQHPKEEMDVFCDGKVYHMSDYTSLNVAGNQACDWQGTQNKGHKQELLALANTIQNGGEWPIALWQQIQASKIAFEVERKINNA